MDMITLTKTAITRFKQQLAKRGKGIGIRLGVQSSGCNGMSYILEYVDEVNDADTVIEQDGFVVAVDKIAAVYLTGLIVDYVKQGLNEGFEFTNPNSTGECGCGKSFTI